MSPLCGLGWRIDRVVCVKNIRTKNKREYGSVVCYIYPSALNKIQSRGKKFCQLDATYGIDGTDYQYLRSWTQKMVI
jgi:hypothetical protein